MESEHASGAAAHVLDAVRAKRAVVLSKPKRHDQLATFEALDRELAESESQGVAASSAQLASLRRAVALMNADFNPH